MTEHNGIPAPAITFDNIHLSKVISPPPANPKLANNCTSQEQAPGPSKINCTDPRVLNFVAAATSPNTRRAYASDLRHYERWGGSIPATDQMVARYLADHAGFVTISTLMRRQVAIRSAHVSAGLPDPTKSQLVRLTLRGISRIHGQPQRRVAALSKCDLSDIIRSVGKSVKDLRDVAILLVGFAGAFRRSELAAINRQDIDIDDLGILVRISRSKTDQEGRGRVIFMPRVAGQLCPFAALQQWLIKANIIEGPVFRRVTKNGKVSQHKISPAAIASIVKQRVEQIGRDSSGYSGHSLRAGFATEAARLGVPAWRIKAQTGHLSDSAFERYIREGQLRSAEGLKNLVASVAGGDSNQVDTPQVWTTKGFKEPDASKN